MPAPEAPSGGTITARVNVMTHRAGPRRRQGRNPGNGYRVHRHRPSRHRRHDESARHAVSACPPQIRPTCARSTRQSTHPPTSPATSAERSARDHPSHRGQARVAKRTSSRPERLTGAPWTRAPGRRARRRAPTPPRARRRAQRGAERVAQSRTRGSTPRAPAPTRDARTPRDDRRQDTLRATPRPSRAHQGQRELIPPRPAQTAHRTRADLAPDRTSAPRATALAPLTR